MKGSITQLTAGLAVAALIALPASVAAQTPPSQPPTTQPPATSGSQSSEATQDQASREAAREHLAKAKAALADVNTSTLSARAKSEITELNRRMNALERAVAANDHASATGEAARSTRATPGSRNEWGTELGAIDKTLTTLIGPQSANTTGTPPSAVGTTGSATSPSAIVVDETSRAKLMEVRSHLTAFATAMAGGDPKTPTPSRDPTTDPNAAAGAPTGSSQQPTGTSGMSQQPPPAAATQTAQPDEQAARRHLTEARNTLSEITQLPAAAQLSGDTRTQVSQLISNFNELISSQSDWRGAYAKVSANLNALIGSESGVTTDPTVSGTTGAVGTSGSANLDPEIRSRLVELRRQLSEFEKAAGGGTAATPSASATLNPPPADPNAPAPTTPPTGTTPPATTPPTTAPPSTTPPTTAPPSTTPPTTAPPSAGAPAGAQTAPGTGGAQAGNAEAMRQIAAIEALLKSEDDSGGITLTKAQLEQLRTHLASLRQALGR